jgi:hypothetical protein
VPQDYKTYPKPFKPNGPVVANIDTLLVPAREYSRPDRLVAWSNGPVLSIFEAGNPKPIATATFPEQPTGCAWMDKDLLVWGETKLSLYKNDGAEMVWAVDMGHLAPIEVIASDQPAAPDAANEQVAINQRLQRRVIINQGQRVLIRQANGVVRLGVPPAPAVKAVVGGPEQIDQVLPVGERILITTTSGRVASVESNSGHLSWQTRLTDRPIDRIVADENFTVIKAEDDAAIRLAVLDTFTGHVRGSKAYPRDSNSFPQNIALSPDGTLVYTLPDRLCLRDLYRPWDQHPIEKVVAPGQATFLGLTQPDQLVISEDRILALTDSGSGDRPGEKFVRLYSLQTGEPVLLKFGENQLDKAWSIGTKSSDVVLRVVGRRVYVIAPDAAICYSLDTPDEHYQMFDQDSGEGMSAQMSFIGQDYLLLLNGGTPPVAPNPAAPNAPPAGAAPPPANQQPAVSPSYTIYAFSRSERNGRESGRLDYSTPISDPAGITSAWQAMDGGLAYLTADHKLHMLIGAK